MAQAQTTAEEGCTVKLYGDDQLLETKWYKWGEKIELPEYYQRDYIKDGSEVKTETIYIREWKWQDSKGSISCAVDRDPQLTVSKELSLTENGEIEVKGYSRVDSAYINQAKVLVKFCVGGEIVKTAWYAQGDTCISQVIWLGRIWIPGGIRELTQTVTVRPELGRCGWYGSLERLFCQEEYMNAHFM